MVIYGSVRCTSLFCCTEAWLCKYTGKAGTSLGNGSCSLRQFS